MGNTGLHVGGSHVWSGMVIIVVVINFVASMGGAQAADAPKYEIVSDIPYPHDGTDYAQERCKLDLYLPKDQKDFPVLVWFHGGYLEDGGGSKWTRPEAAQRFAAEGFGVVLPNYRGYPRATYPKFIEDAASVVAWTYHNIAAYGGNPKHLFVGGHSAGAYLAAMVGMDARYLEQHHLSTRQIVGVISLSGEMLGTTQVWVGRRIWPKIIDETTPMFYVRRDVPPFLCVCATRNSLNVCEESQQFIEALRATGHDNATFAVVPGSNDLSRRNEPSIEEMKVPDDPVVKLMLTFMQNIIAGTVPAPAVQEQKIAEEKSLAAADLNKELGWAAGEGDVEKVKALIASGADVNSRMPDDHTPLTVAAYGGHYEVVKMLIEAGADVNAVHHTDETVLSDALKGRVRAEVIQLLLDAGVNLNPMSLIWAVEDFSKLSTAGEKSEGLKITSMLIDAGADVNAQEQSSGFTPLFYAACIGGSNQFIDLLLRSGAEINATVGASGMTALACAVEMKHTETVKFLIEAGADLEMADKSGNTPLMRAKNRRLEEIVKLLTDAGATR